MWKKKAIAISFAIIMIASMMLIPVSLADPDIYDTPTQAVVSGAGQPPFFKMVWILEDEDPAKVGTQVYCEPYTNKTLTAYMVASDPNGAADIQRVFVKVFHPDKSFKYQVENYVNLDRTGAEIISAIDKGVNIGIINSTLAQDMKTQLSKQEARAYKIALPITYKQMPGIYNATAFAVDTGGNTGALSGFFEYYSLKFMKVDFTSLNYGPIVPGVKQVISGDEDMLTPLKPTVQNGGNTDVTIGVRFDSMIGANLGKIINDFDAVFRDQELSLVGGGDWMWFANPLEVCHTRQIDFSVTPPLGTPADSYTGAMYITWR